MKLKKWIFVLLGAALISAGIPADGGGSYEVRRQRRPWQKEQD